MLKIPVNLVSSGLHQDFINLLIVFSPKWTDSVAAGRGCVCRGGGGWSSSCPPQLFPAPTSRSCRGLVMSPFGVGGSGGLVDSGRSIVSSGRVGWLDDCPTTARRLGGTSPDSTAGPPFGQGRAGVWSCRPYLGSGGPVSNGFVSNGSGMAVPSRAWG
jgi:hypothetical protein